MKCVYCGMEEHDPWCVGRLIDFHRTHSREIDKKNPRREGERMTDLAKEIEKLENEIKEIKSKHEKEIGDICDKVCIDVPEDDFCMNCEIRRAKLEVIKRFLTDKKAMEKEMKEFPKAPRMFVKGHVEKGCNKCGCSKMPRKGFRHVFCPNCELEERNSTWVKLDIENKKLKKRIAELEAEKKNLIAEIEKNAEIIKRRNYDNWKQLKEADEHEETQIRLSAMNDGINELLRKLKGGRHSSQA